MGTRVNKHTSPVFSQLVQILVTCVPEESSKALQRTFFRRHSSHALETLERFRGGTSAEVDVSEEVVCPCSCWESDITTPFTTVDMEDAEEDELSWGAWCRSETEACGDTELVALSDPLSELEPWGLCASERGSTDVILAWTNVWVNRN
ncbi:hypothetical protein OGAPHI_000265 [Ogataea philodendri]|uniref:Uncharacterized protein n=1 Tax=Ogataea philodendri TaxID=1378263 RepID=A0A9P8PHV7_9ASCO|nr:uncharacterized protein OGAPHI_000265 [Ogataea philodendri]KAH3671562.1 hypothetical protein OGAPHI_000265 [Ogataea philodendri]